MALARRVSASTPSPVPAQWAPARNDSADLITVLLKAGADPSARDSMGVTPLAIAKQVGSMKAMDLLKDAKTPAAKH